MSDVTLDTLRLAKGPHRDRSAGLCLMEAVAWYAGEPHTDRPQCVCPVLGAMGRGLNDCMPDDERQQLRDLIPLLVGTAGDDSVRTRRAYLAMDWIVRVYTPAWLDQAGLTDRAADLRALPELADAASLRAARPVVNTARASAASAASAARNPAVWDVTWVVTKDTAWAAAWVAARDAVSDREVVGVIASAAARDAATAAATTAVTAAATAAVKDDMQNTSRALRASALALFRRMIDLRGTPHDPGGRP